MQKKCHVDTMQRSDKYKLIVGCDPDAWTIDWCQNDDQIKSNWSLHRQRFRRHNDQQRNIPDDLRWHISPTFYEQLTEIYRINRYCCKCLDLRFPTFFCSRRNQKDKRNHTIWVRNFQSGGNKHSYFMWTKNELNFKVNIKLCWQKI